MLRKSWQGLVCKLERIEITNLIIKPWHSERCEKVEYSLKLEANFMQKLK